MIAFGLVVGMMVVVMPPLAWIAIIAITLVVLLWVMPDLHLVSDGLIRKLFFVAVTIQFSVPVYFAFAVQGLPWISIRRVSWLTMLALAALTLATSAEARARVARTLAEVKEISVPAIWFMICIPLSVLTSTSWTNSLRDTSEAFLYWFMALFTYILCVKSENDVRFLVKIFCYLAFIGGSLGFIEYILQRHFIPQLWPQAMIERLFAENPQLLENIVRNVIRNGQFRSNYIYNVSLSFGEFLATCVPLCLCFCFHWRTKKELILGILGTIACILGIFASGSRGAYLGASVAIPLFVILWIARYMKQHPNSLVGPTAAVSLLGFVSGFTTLAIAWARLRVLFTGGAEGAGSTDTRFVQWALAKQWIMSNPVTGHGQGVGATVVGYYTPGNQIPSLDSYIISLLVELGIPGLVTFFLMLIAASYLLIRVYLTDNDPASSFSGAIGCAIISFSLYRLALSQRENHVLLFLLIGAALVEIAASRRRLGAGLPAKRRLGGRARLLPSA
jgi:hypothetical protein